MNASLLVLITVAVSFCAFVTAFFVFQRLLKPTATNDSTLQPFLQLQQELHNLNTTLQDQIQTLSGQMNDQMKQNSQFLQENQQNYRQVMGDVQHRLGILQHATQSMMDIGKDIASLQDILRAPKLRGGMGSYSSRNFCARSCRKIISPFSTVSRTVLRWTPLFGSAKA